jgi:hypothetical protein
MKSNTNDYGGKTQQNDSQNNDTKAPIGRQLHHLQQLRVKRTGREADHSPPTSAVVKNAWSFSFTPKYVMAWCLGKHKEF